VYLRSVVKGLIRSYIYLIYLIHYDFVSPSIDSCIFKYIYTHLSSIVAPASIHQVYSRVARTCRLISHFHVAEARLTVGKISVDFPNWHEKLKCLD